MCNWNNGPFLILQGRIVFLLNELNSKPSLSQETMVILKSFLNHPHEEVSATAERVYDNTWKKLDVTVD